MKTTDKDSNIKQSNETVDSEKLAKNTQDQQALPEQGAEDTVELTDAAAGEQLDLAFANAQLLAMADNIKEDLSKRKKKDKLDEELENEQILDDESIVSVDSQSAGQIDQFSDENSEGGLVSEALEGGSAGGPVFELSLKTLVFGLPVLMIMGSQTKGDTRSTGNLPKISSGEDALVDENSGLDQVVYTAVASIPGGGANKGADITFSLSANSDSVFSIDEYTGEVSISVDPDFEVQSEYSFTVIATDSYGNKSSQPVNLEVKNIDDTAPQITSADSVAVDENNVVDQVVYTAAVDDSADLSEGPVSYSLSSSSDYRFSIDAATGEVAMSEAIDFEQDKTEYFFTVIATDSADNSSQKTVNLSFQNVDEIAPTITSATEIANVSEDIILAIPVYTATADDSADTSDGVTFALTEGSDPALSINADTGAVTLNTTPDFFTQNLYSFGVIATDAAGNESTLSLSFELDEIAPGAPVVGLKADTGSVNDDFITNETEILVSNLKLGAKWEYSYDNGVIWFEGSASVESETDSFILPPEAEHKDGDDPIQVLVRQANISNPDAPVESESPLVMTLDTTSAAPVNTSVDTTANSVTIVYNELLDVGFLPLASDFTVTRNSETFAVESVVVSGSSVVLSFIDITEGALQITYTPSSSLMQDIAGNQVQSGFSQAVVADGYIRGAEVYVDLDNDGIADGDELLVGVTTDSLGQVVLSDDQAGGHSIIIQGGVDTFTGVANQIQLTAPSGYSVINPLSTLVLEILKADETKSVDAAEAALAFAIGIELTEGEDLSSYDPFSDSSDNAASNQAKTLQIATILAVVSDDEAEAEAEVLAVLTTEVLQASENDVVLVLSRESINDVLVDVVTDDQLAVISTAVQEIKDASESDATDTEKLEAMVTAQAVAIDTVAPNTPQLALNSDSDTGIQNDEITSDTTPSIKIILDTIAKDGGAASKGDMVLVSYTNLENVTAPVNFEDAENNPNPHKLSQTDINNGFVTFDIATDFPLPHGSVVTVSITDKAGRVSVVDGEVFATEIIIDTEAALITSGAVAGAVDENSGAGDDETGPGQVIYTVTSEDSVDAPVSYSLSSESDSALAIDSLTGEVTLTTVPDYETQSVYSFKVIATDAAGNVSEPQSVTLDINNLDEIAPRITYDASVIIDENSGKGTVIFTAQAEDIGDGTDGIVTFGYPSPVNGLRFNSDGTVVLEENIDYEITSSMSFSLIAVDSAGNISDPKTINIVVNNLDDTAPVFTSPDNASVNENIGAAQVVYTAVADDSADVSDGITYSLLEATQLSIPVAEANTQHVYVSSSTITTPGDDNSLTAAQQTIVVSYNSVNTVTGLGLRVHYDSAALTLSEITDFLTEVESGADFVITPTIEGAEADASDHDNNAATDMFVNMSWLAFNGGWPTAELPVDLITMSFDIAEGTTSSVIGFSSTSTAAGYTFDGQDQELILQQNDSALTINSETGVVSLADDPNYEGQSQYGMTVRVTDDAGNTSEKAVTIDVTNLDEIAPTITSGAEANDLNDIKDNQGNITDVVEGDIDENSGAGQVIYTATAVDSTDDVVSEPITFSLAEGSDSGLSIDSVSGKVTLTANPDHETQSEYTFVVIATDGADNESDPQTVTLTINDLDDSAPEITSGAEADDLNDILDDQGNVTDVVEGDIDENSGAGQVIYTATAVDSTADVATPPITFSLAEGSDTGLSINSATGEVTLTANPDHETQSEYTFAVIATDGADNESDPQTVTLTVNDLDEVAPEIISVDFAPSIYENTGAGVEGEENGQVIYTAIADDSTDHSDGVTFSLTQGSDPALSINETNGKVTLNTIPNFEQQSVYTFGVVATDAANNVSEPQSVTLNITNLDEIAPTITSGAVADAIDENSGAEQVIYTATAMDSTDDVASEPLVFSFSEDSDAGLSIDSVTGDVTLTADPDHEAQSEYNFAVVATDAAGNASAEQAVTLTINDLDDSAPAITSGAAVAIDENSGAEQVIYTATAVDSSDDVASEPLVFSFSEGSDAGLSIDSVTGDVTLTADPDHEAQSEYNFAVVATDAAGNASAEQAVTLTINDLDDSAPAITSGAAVAIDENSGAEQVVYTATAMDSTDDVASEPLVFSFAEGSDAGLSIDSATGDVTLTADPDHETQSEYNFAVVATDAAGNASTEQAVTLTINDLDDSAPAITSGVAVAIDENSGAGQVIYTATAEDSNDDVASEPFVFSLVDDLEGALAIDPSTGDVTLNVVPDHETQSVYNFEVFATDAAGNVSDSQPVTLNINDIDEVSPVFTSADVADAIEENSGAGQLVYTAATDDSGDISEGVIYRPLDPEEFEKAFTINDFTGDVFLTADPDYETQSTYSFSILADDGYATEVVKHVTLDITNIDDTAPTVADSTNQIAIDENVGSTEVYTAAANDTYDVSNGVTFSLSESSDSALSIHVDTGVVTLTVNPDHEVQSVYTFDVIATDAVGNSSEPHAVTLTINDLDDVAPTITSLETADSIDENTGVDQVVYTAAADDTLDISVGPVTFALLEDESDSALSIDSATGEVTLRANPDHEAQSEYSFDFVATDAAGNESQAMSVTISVNDIDDAAPTITNFVSTVNIDENSGAGQVVYTVTADDLGDISDDVSFSFTEDNVTGLSINAETGEVTLIADPDHETQSEYTFAVIATDSAGNVSASKSITLNINNLDEVAPTVISANTVTAVDENSGAAQVIYTANANDSDDVSDGVSFSLAAASDAALSIDAATGAVTLSADPDADTQSQYSFAVVATDAAGNESAAQSVTLDINNLDDTAATITSGDVAVAIDENSGSGQVIYTATADDSADVSDGISFSLAAGSDAALSIDTDSGAVTLSADPDADTQSVYDFTVVVTDVAGNASEQAVSLDINNLDEVAPEIISPTTAAVLESKGAGVSVYQAIVDDSADVNDGTITYSLTGVDASAFEINASGSVTILDDPEAGTQAEYNFTVVATDGANNASEQTVTLTVVDQDLEAPEFTSAVSVAIDENSGADQEVYVATVQESSPYSFALSNDSDSALTIDAASGVVTLAGDPDADVQAQYDFTVVATDEAGNVSEHPVALTINDLDELSPTITSGVIAAEINENSGAGQVIYTVTADDSADVSEGVTFSLAAGSDAALSIDADSGAVTLNADPDAETQTQYSFTVVATDGAGNTSDQSVTLDVADVDDTAATITSGDTADAIYENSGSGQVIYTVTADDSADVSEGVTFSLAAGSDAALSIDATTGAVTLNADPDADVQAQYSFTVEATDAAGNVADQSVTLDINNLDDTAAIITSVGTADAIDENSGSSQVIYTATADDSADVSGGVTFSLADNDDSSLSINPYTGVVTLFKNPDADTQAQYSFTVVVTDEAGNASNQAVTLDINNLDDTAPVITSLNEVESIQEFAGSNEIIYTITADDSSDVSGGVTFSLVDDLDGVLSIDAVTGAVTLNENPVYHIKSQYSFAVIATDAAGNISEALPLVLNVIESLPPTPTFELVTDSSNSTDNISNNGEVSVGNIKPGATWEYSIDGGSNWNPGTGSGFTIEFDGTHQVKVKQTNSAGSTETGAVQIVIDTAAPIVQFVSADSDVAVQTISVNYNEVLDPASLPDAGDYVISQNGNPLTVSSVALDTTDNSILVLNIIEAFNPGAMNFEYIPSDNVATDLAGNELDQGFMQMIVSDGYIRGAQVYIDVNGDGIADESELREEVTSDAFGQIILTDEFLNAAENIDSNGNPYQVIVKGGVNMDSGAPNEIELTAPAGYSVINPLSTLVQEIASSLEDEVDTAGMSEEEIAIAKQAAKDAAKLAAEKSLEETLGISLEEGSSLGSYDPQSDDNVANRVIATQIATVLAVASSTETTGSEGAETAALASLADTISSAEGEVTLDSATMGEVLDGVVVDTAALDALNLAVDAMEAVKNSQDSEAAFAAIVQAQAVAIDSVAPQAPTPDFTLDDAGIALSESGASNTDGVINVASPQLTVTFNTDANDGSAVIAGDTLDIISNSEIVKTFNLDADDIERGYVDYTWEGELSDGVKYISARMTDIAGNKSFVSTFKFTLDTQALDFVSGDQVNINENTGADQVVHSVTVGSDDLWKLELTGDSDPELTIDSDGNVSLADNPDYETNPVYSFTVLATDNAGNTSQQLVTLNVNNLDEIAPNVTSDVTADAVDENSGAAQVIYTATAEDSTDDVTSKPINFSLTDDSDSGLMINSVTGEVTLTINPDHEDKSVYSFGVIATDSAVDAAGEVIGNSSAPKIVTLNINDLDDSAPMITSGSKADDQNDVDDGNGNITEVFGHLNENTGAGQLIYTATAVDSDDDVASKPFTFSLLNDLDGKISIDSSTGQVTLNEEPDYEAQTSYNFVVEVTDAAGNQSLPQSVTLKINNLDEIEPSITSGAVADAINENSGAGLVIYTATSEDSADDHQEAPISYSLSDDSDTGLSINSSTGEVTLTADPDHEAQSEYTFAVIATDGAGNESAPQSVTLTINDLDDSAPSVTSGAVADAIDENSGAEQVIYTVTADDSGDDIADTPITFSLVDDLEDALSIDASSGDVSLTDSPDHETESVYTFAVIATDGAGNESTPQTVTLNINDLDDAAPVFTSPDTATVLESVALIVPYDPPAVYQAVVDDSADINDGIIAYTLDGADADSFAVSESGLITMLDVPDATVQLEYSFNVVATDGADNSSSHPITLTVVEQDIEGPIFTSSSSVAIDENVGENQVVYTATSQDQTGPISYDLAEGSDFGLSINSGTGEVTLTVDPDHEAQPVYNFTVIATDSSKDVDVPNSSELEVTLTINNVDEALPTVTSAAVADSIDENTGAGDEDQGIEPGQVIYMATAEDSAEDVQKGPISYKLSEDSDSALIIDSESGEVTLTTVPDADTQDQYTFAVIATDGAGNESDPQTVTLNINDLDDSAPEISSVAVATAIDENTGAGDEDLGIDPGQVIYTATADDSGDDVADTPITFRLSDDSDSALIIDSESGDVTLTTVPDADTQDQYTFAVIATDGAGNESDPQTVTLNINDLDDSAPEITSVAVATAIDENTGAGDEDLGIDPGQVIYKAIAEDSAEDVATLPITFRLSDDSDSALIIDSESGDVTLTTVPDADTQDQYTFAVIATDGAGNESDPQTVTLNINDLDDSAPEITSVAVATAIDENTGAGDEDLGIDPGQVIYTATADDSGDDVADTPITFRLSDDSDSALIIDSESGEVTLTTVPDADTQDQYTFAVIATDGAGNESDPQTVTLNINDLDDSAPEISSVAVATAIDENTGAGDEDLGIDPGQVIYTATADDSGDDVADTPITFRLSDDSDSALIIDSESGDVTLTTVPDADTQDQYTFAVIATDGAGNESDPQTVTLNINDLDDSAPEITSVAVATAIDENTGAGDEDLGIDPGQVIYKAIAEDSAEDVATLPITFRLSGDSDPALIINSESGEVTLTTVPDHEVQSEYTFAVIATDGAGNESDPQTVTLNINDLDDSAPEITSVAVATAIDENTGAGDEDLGIDPGQVIYTATADDSGDDVADTPITFRLSDDSDSALIIDSESGEVTLTTVPDADTQDQYTFAVIATDGAGNESDPQTVTLNINDLDDTAATITSGDTAAAIDENSGSGQVIYKATADDSADVSDGVIFSLAAGSDAALSIDADTGAVTLNADPDHETQAQYSFTVVATDVAGNESAGQAVTLDITDVDDSAPAITSVAVAEAIDENSGAGQVIYTATAEDSADDEVSEPFVFSFVDDLEGALSIDASSGEVTLTVDPDYEAQPEYTFAVVATDAVGNVSEAQSVTLTINNLDEVAPTISSADLVAVDENSGAEQVVYTAIADDTADVSDGVTFSFAEDEITQISIPEVVANTQHVYVSSSNLVDGNQEITVSYNADSNVTGLGIKVHYDSSALTLSDITDVLQTNIFITPDVVNVEADTDNEDGNADTDMLINMSWASFTGSSWPGSKPADLLTMTFDIAEGASSTSIGFSDTSTASGYAFDGQDQALALREPRDTALSIDAATGEVTLATNPDYEPKAEYSFGVVATDAAGLDSEVQSVTVQVNDVDEIAPVITSVESVAVDENSSPIIYTATAVDTADAELTPTDPENITFAMDSVMSISHQNSQVSQKVTQNEDGSFRYSLSLVDNYADHLVDGAINPPGSLDFYITYDAEKLEIVTIPNETEIDLPTYGENNTHAIGGFWAPIGNVTSPGSASIGAIDLGVMQGNPSGFEDDLVIAEFDFNIIGNTDSEISVDVAWQDNLDLIESVTTAIDFDNSALVMDSNGEVSVASGPDYEVQADYYFSVTATDALGNTSEAQAVTVNINNIDEAAPVITSEAGVIAVNVDANPVIYTAMAVDSVDDVVSEPITLSFEDTTDYSAVVLKPESPVSTPSVEASTQHVYVSSSTKSTDGTQETIVVSYNAEANVTGLGFEVLFDSSALTLSDVSDVLQTNLFIAPAVGNVLADSSDKDGNSDTDSSLNMSWASFVGSTWPGTAPANLLSMTFDLADGFDGDFYNSTINFVKTSGMAGWEFDGQAHDIVIPGDSSSAHLVFDNSTGTVVLDVDVDSVLPSYSFTVTATDAAGKESDLDVTVPVVEVGEVVNADASSYTGTAEADVFALADGSAEITSDAGTDVFVLDPAFASATHTITDFESGVDAIDISAALVAAGYTADNAPTQLLSADMSADILDLVNDDDSNLDNLFGATYDDASNTLTVFADSDSSAGSTDMDSFQITLDDSATVEDDDIVADLSAFIA